MGSGEGEGVIVNYRKKSIILLKAKKTEFTAELCKYVGK